MRIFILLTFCFFYIHQSNSQCIKEISTNFHNPFNQEFLPLIDDWYPNTGPHTVNSFINSSVEWYRLQPNFSLPSITLTASNQWSDPWKVVSNLLIMNPFLTSSHLREPSEQRFRDVYWEDGWELLWSNLGRFPNGDPVGSPSSGSFYAENNLNYVPFPPNIPYFVLYNRYRGMIRLFSRTYYDDQVMNFQDLEVEFLYNLGDLANGNLSGVLRHSNGGFDRPLDLPTETRSQKTPRKSPGSNAEFQVSEFQVGFDPCVCLKQKTNSSKTPGMLDFRFNQITTMEIDMKSRTYELQDKIDLLNFSAIDFLNFTEINPNDYKPGMRMYQQAEKLYDDYTKRLLEYENELNDYNQTMNESKKELLKLGRDFVVGTTLSAISPGLNTILPILKLKGDKVNKTNESALKGLLGIGYDKAMFELMGKPNDKPVKPTVPVASFSETSYKGDITHTNVYSISNLRIPGAITESVTKEVINPNNGNPEDVQFNYGYGRETDILPSNFPAYNKVLGQVALLESPKIDLVYEDEVISQTYRDYHLHESECFVIVEAETNLNIELKIMEELKIALNNSLDFDYSKTNTYAAIVIEFERDFITLSEFLNDVKPSGWIPSDLQSYPLIGYEENESNFNLHHVLEKKTTNHLDLVYISNWFNIKDLNQQVFIFKEKYYLHYLTQREQIMGGCGKIKIALEGGAIGEHEANQFKKFGKIKSIKLKLLHDMYFEQMGSFDQQVNTTQVYTYPIYTLNNQGIPELSKNVTQIPESSSIRKYKAGKMIIGNEHIVPGHDLVWEQIGNTLIINAEEVEIQDNITVAPGYELIIQALYDIMVVPNAMVGQNITLKIKKDWFDLQPFEYTSQAEVYNFCNDSEKYKAGLMTRGLREQVEKEIQERKKREEEEKERNKEDFKIYPNPSKGELVLTDLPASATHFEVLSNLGQLMYSAEVNKGDNRHYMNSLLPGTYHIVLHRRNNTPLRKVWIKM